MSKEKDFKVGQKVTYVPDPRTYNRRELGKVTSINDWFVFVDYGGGTSQPTSREDLQVGDQTFYCPDEHNSVLDGAFGRCESICQRCYNQQTFLTHD